MKAINEIEQILLDAVNDGAFPGANYAVVTKNNVWMGSIGNKELYPEVIPNSIDTIYDMASLTKVVCTTTCLMQLVEKGLLRIYDPVSRYFDKFRFTDITVWNLMTHTSGLPEGIYGPKDKLSESDVWDKIFAIEELKFKPGTKIIYSDINYILLGKIVEILSGMPINEYAKKNLFEPLEMVDSGYLPFDKVRCAATEYRNDATMTGYVKGEVHDETAYAMNKVAGHAGLFSTVKDCSNFIKMILNDGMFNGTRVLSKITIDELFKVQVKEYNGVEVLPKARCLGWQTKEPACSAGELVSENTILHTGFTGTNMFIDRDNEIGFVMLSNRVHPTRNNGKLFHVRACVANFIMAHLEEFKND